MPIKSEVEAPNFWVLRGLGCVFRVLACLFPVFSHAAVTFGLGRLFLAARAIFGLQLNQSTFNQTIIHVVDKHLLVDLRKCCVDLDLLNLNLVHPRRFYGLQCTNQQFQRVFHIWQIVKSNEGSSSPKRTRLRVYYF